MVAMMILIVLTLELVLLAIGLGVGYWIITTAIGQERGLRMTGLVFGWILVVMAFLISIMSSAVAIQNWRTGYVMGSPTMHEMMRDYNMPMMNGNHED